MRGALRSQGLAEAALQVDSAWISTIHGMCSRILHDHALDLGLDPEFKLVADVLAACDRRAAGPCAPAKGLSFAAVEYPDGSLAPWPCAERG